MRCCQRREDHPALALSSGDQPLLALTDEGITCVLNSVFCLFKNTIGYMFDTCCLVPLLKPYSCNSQLTRCSTRRGVSF